MNTRTAAAALVAAALLTLTACSGSDDEATPDARPSATASKQTPSENPARVAGLPPEPDAAGRAELLRVLAAANPDIVKYEDKAVDAARNQCMAINGGAERLDYFASQRFTYKDVTTTEAQGKQINEALKGIGFCEV
ncbi:hypothetical protein [Streptomyces sp. SID5910]|uniref:hypothetical protein n=1 Tax=Streptomyces sp. SID5910 TaxID=2690312 RepID=UPI001371B226|nr:hypothetical protein [Streptomyces sp. SID5910]MYR42088.1 hypothetical protein [Streptomyces sp. SID5910]